MKIFKEDKYVIVEKGDTLSGIASNLDVKSISNGATYQQLAAINGISNPNLIVVGQKIYLTKTSSTKKASSNMVSIKHFGVQSDTDRTMYAAWDWTKTHTKEYKVQWYYGTGDDVWFIGEEKTETVKQSVYNAPSNAKRVKFRVKPVATTHKVNNKDTVHWTAEWTAWKQHDFAKTVETPPTPSVSIDGYQLKAKLDSLYIDAKSIEFQVVKNNTAIYKTVTATISKNYASITCTVPSGGEYKVRCRAVKGGIYSSWSDYSSNQGTIPEAVKKITKLTALSETSVYVDWDKATGAKKYEVQYTEQKRYFDSSGEVQSITVNEDTNFNHAEVTGLESGKEYFFRVRACNDQGNSSWTEAKSIKIGTKPGVPTTWASTTTAITGEKLNLYWVHNSEDGSSETTAEVEITIGSSKPVVDTVPNKSKDDADKAHSYPIDTSKYTSGTTIKWRVRTKGIIDKWSDWSVQRVINVYAPPTLSLELGVIYENTNELIGLEDSTVRSYPFGIQAIPGPRTQNAIGYHVSIVPESTYPTTDELGNDKFVNEGEEIYSKYYDINDADLLVSFTPSDVILENGVTYTINCTVSMDSGLTAENSVTFNVALDETSYTPSAQIAVDPNTLVAFITPECEEETSVILKVNYDDANDRYVVTDEEADGVYGEEVEGAYTNTANVSSGNSVVYKGVDSDGNELYYCIQARYDVINDILFSVYRREFDGSFTEIEKDIDGGGVTVVDMHPSLDLARYRIIAKSKTTGRITYADIPGYPVGETAVIIQWDEAWTPFNVTEEDELEEPPWAGSMLRLPYNIDVSESNEPDVSLVEYIGRKNPVSYYGTQLGIKPTWNVEIEKSDKDTLYMLRRLAMWMGDVYVREPSGSGYWANVAVSFSQKHCEMSIPVTINITRVEGGA
ncbi:MAG: LysM peptidoglycan-binding domain-containing protein [Ruminococcus sp.]|nr:LysM peptidoglycan-binding domain-containing protein [Ruminococcus sp.]